MRRGECQMASRARTLTLCYELVHDSLNYSSRLRARLHTNPSADGRHDAFSPRTARKQKGCSRKKIGFGSVPTSRRTQLMSAWAMCGRLRVGKSFLHVAALFGAAELWGPQQHPLPWRSRAGGGTVPCISSGSPASCGGVTPSLQELHEIIDRGGQYRGGERCRL